MKIRLYRWRNQAGWILSFIWAAALPCTSGAQTALPTGGQIIAGQATIQQSANALKIQQDSPQAIIHWQDFSIGAGNSVQFIQPNAASSALNRVVGNNLSQIYGTLTANGQIYLINPNGIVIGPGGVINAAGFVGSTLNMANSDFLNGNAHFVAGALDGGFVNHGTIRTSLGNVTILSSSITNNGTITTPGTLKMAAGKEIYLAPEDGVPVIVSEADFATIQNNGALKAGNIYAAVIRATPVTRVTSENWRQTLHIVNTGEMKADGSITARGGTVEDHGQTQAGQRIDLRGVATIVTGDETAPEIRLGGDWHGASGFNGQRTTVSGRLHGQDVVLWSEEATTFTGTIQAPDINGQAEISSHGTLHYAGHVQLNGGNLLLDPANITISTSGANFTYSASTDLDTTADYSGADVTILVSDLANVINSGSSVTLYADNTITLSAGANLNLSNTSGSLTVNAGINLFLNGAITLANAAAVLNLNATTGSVIVNGAVSSVGAVNLTAGTGINVNQGISGSTISLTTGTGGTINVNSGGILQGVSGITLGNISTSAVTFNNSFNDAVSTDNLSITAGNFTVATGSSLQTAANVTVTTTNNVTFNDDVVVGKNLTLNGGNTTNVTQAAGRTLQAGNFTATTNNFTAGGDIISNGTLSLTAANALSVLNITGAVVNLTAAGVAMTGTGNLTATGGGNITVTADALSLGTGTIKGTGAVVIQPLTTGTTIGVGTGAAGSLNVSNAVLTALAGSNFTNITIGRSTGTGAISILNPSAFTSPVNFLTTGIINLNGAVTGTGNAGVRFNGNVQLTGSSSVTTANQTITFNGTLNGAQTLTLNAGTGWVNLLSNVGNNIVLSGLTITESGSDLTQSAAWQVNNLTANVGGRNITLTSATNDFTTVTLATNGTGNITLNEANGFTFNNVTLGTGTLTTNVTTGNVGESGALTIPNLVLRGGANYQLNNSANNFTNLTANLTGTGQLNVASNSSASLTLGAITTAGGAVSVSLTNAGGNGTLTTTAAITSNGGTINLVAPNVNVTNSVNAGAGGNVTLAADSLAVSGAVTGTGTLGLRPFTNTTTIGVGNGASGTLQLTDALLGQFSNFSAVAIGNSGINTGPISLTDLTWAGSAMAISFNTNSTVSILGNLALNGTSSLTFNAPVSVAFASAGNVITTANGSLTFNNAVSLAVNTSLRSTGSGSLIFGANATVDGARNLVLNATTGAITMNGAIGSGTALTGLTAVSGGAVTLGNSVTTTGAISLTSSGSTIMASGALTGASLTATAAANLNLNGTTNVTGGNVSLTSSGGAISTAALTAANVTATTANGGITFNGVTNVSGSLVATSTGSGSLNFTGAINAGTVTATTSTGTLTTNNFNATTATLTSGGAMTFNGPATLANNLVANSTGGTITVNNAVSSSGGTINARSNGTFTIGVNGSISASSTNGTITLTSTSGQISSNTNNTSSGTNANATISAATVNLAAATGIINAGNTNLLLSATNITAINSGTGNINLTNNNTAGTTLNNLSTAGGSLAFSQIGGGNLTVVGNVTSGNPANGGSIRLQAANNFIVANTSTISSANGTGGSGNVTTFTADGVTINGTITFGAGNITLQGGNTDTIINSPNIATASGTNTTYPTTATINLSSKRDIIVNSSLSTTLSTANIILTADSDSDGVGGVWITANGNVSSAGNVTLIGSDIFATQNGLPDSVRIDTGGRLSAAGAVALRSTAVTVAPANGQIIINGTISGTSVSVTNSATNGTIALAANVTGTTGNVTFSNNVLLANTTTVTGVGVNFLGTVDGAQSLTVNAGAGLANFSSTIGATTPLTNLTILATGGNLTQNGAWKVGNFTGNVGNTTNSIILTNPGNDFTGTVTVADNGTGNITVSDTNGFSLGTVTLANGTLTLNAGGNLALSTLSLGNQTVVLNVSNGTVTQAGALTTGNLVLVGNGTYNLTNTTNAVSLIAANITGSGSLNFTDGTTTDLTVGSGNFTTYNANGAINTVTPVNGITVTGAGGVTLMAGNLTVSQAVNSTSGGITLNTTGNVVVNDNVTATTNLILGSGTTSNITLAAGKILQGANTSLSVGNLIANGSLVAGSATGTLNVTAANNLTISNFTAHDVNLRAPNVTLAANTVFTPVGTNGNITFAGDSLTVGANSTISGAAGLGQFTATPYTNSTNIFVGGSGTGLVLPTNLLSMIANYSGTIGSVVIGSSSVTGTINVTNTNFTRSLVFTTANTSTTNVTGNITGQGNLTFSGPVVFQTNSIITAATNGTITFGGTINGAANNTQSVTLNSGTGTVSLGGIIGGTATLANFTVTSGGNLTLNQNITVGGSLALTTNGSISGTGLLTAANLTLNATTGINNGTPAGNLTIAATNITATNNGTGNVNLFNLYNNTTTSARILGLSTMTGNITFNQLGNAAGNVTAGDLTVTGNITSGSGGNITVMNDSALTVSSGFVVRTGSGSNGTINSSGATVSNATLMAGTNTSITLAGQGGDLVISSSTINAAAQNLSAVRDIIISNVISTTSAGANITLTADSDNNGIGGVWIQSTGNVTAAGSVAITGSRIFRAGANANTSIQIDAGGVVNAQNGTLTLSSSNFAPGNAQIIVNGNLTSTGALAVTAGTNGTISLGANVISTGGGVTFNQAVNLTGTAGVNGAGVTFGNTIDGNQTLSVNAGAGVATFNGTIGGTTALTSFSATSGGNVILNQNVTVGGNLNVTSTTGTLTANGIVSAANITAASGGNLTFTGNVAATNNLTATSNNGTFTANGTLTAANLTVSSRNDLTLNQNAAATNNLTLTSTNGSLSGAGNLTAANNLTLSATNGSISNTGWLSGTNLRLSAKNGISNAFNPLNVVATNITATNSGAGDVNLSNTPIGNVVIGGLSTGNGAIQYTQTSGAVAITGAVTGTNTITFDAPANISLGANVTSTGGMVTFYEPVVLIANSTVSGVGVSFTGTLDGNGNQTLGVNAGAGTAIFNGTIGGTTALAGLTVNSSGGNLTQNGAWKVGNLTANAGANSIQLTNANNAFTGNVNLTTTGTGQINLVQAAATNLTISRISAGSGNVTVNADALSFSGNVSGTGNLTLQTVTAARNIVVGGNVVAGTLSLSTASLNRLVDGFANITIGNSTGTGSVTINDAAFKDPVSFQAGNVINLNGNVTANAGTNASFNFGNNVILTGTGSVNTTNSGGNITFARKIDGPFNLTLAAGNGTISFGGAVGGTTALGDLTISQNGNLALNQNVTTYSNLVASSAAGTLIGTGVLSAQNLIATSNGTLTFNGSVTTTGDLTATSTNGTFTANGMLSAASLTASSGNDLILNQNATATGNLTLTSTNGSISGAGNLTAANNLTLSATNGSISNTGLLTAMNLSLSAQTGITNGTASGNLSVSATNITATNSGTGNVSLANAVGANTTASLNNFTTGNGTVRFYQTGGGDLNVVGNVTGHIITLHNNSGALTIAMGSNVTSYGSGSNLTSSGVTINQPVNFTSGFIDLLGNSPDLVITSSQYAGSNSTLNLSAVRDIIVSNVIFTTAGASVNLTADSNNTGNGGVWIKAGGNITSAGSVTIIGSKIANAFAEANTSIQIDAGGVVNANNGSLTLRTSNVAPSNAQIIVNGTVSGTTALTVNNTAGGGTISLGANATSTNGTVSFSSPVNLTGDATVQGTNVTFNGAINGAWNLTLQATNGNVTLPQTSVATLNSTATGTTILHGNITAGGAGTNAVPAILIETNRFQVAAGVSLNTPAGRYVVYSQDRAHDNVSSLVGTFTSLYGQTPTSRPPSSLSGGNRIVWQTAPQVTVTADNVAAIYGNAAVLNYTTSGLYAGDTPALAFDPTFGVTSASQPDVGTYNVTFSGNTTASPLGYVFMLVNGTLTVTKRNLVVTATTGQNKTSGQTDPTLTYAVTSGSLAYNDTLALARAAGETVGNYAYSLGNFPKMANYNTTLAASDQFAVKSLPVVLPPQLPVPPLIPTPPVIEPITPAPVPTVSPTPTAAAAAASTVAATTRVVTTPAVNEVVTATSHNSALPVTTLPSVEPAPTESKPIATVQEAKEEVYTVTEKPSAILVEQSSPQDEVIHPFLMVGELGDVEVVNGPLVIRQFTLIDGSPVPIDLREWIGQEMSTVVARDLLRTLEPQGYGIPHQLCRNGTIRIAPLEFVAKLRIHTEVLN